MTPRCGRAYRFRLTRSSGGPAHAVESLGRGTRNAPMGVAMTTSAAGQPLIPQPSATVAALRQAIRQIVPAALPAFTRGAGPGGGPVPAGLGPGSLATLHRPVGRLRPLPAATKAGSRPARLGGAGRVGGRRPGTPGRSEIGASSTRHTPPSAFPPGDHGVARGVRPRPRPRPRPRGRRCPRSCGGGSGTAGGSARRPGPYGRRHQRPRQRSAARGLRRMDAAGGWFYFLAAPRERLVIIVRIVPPFDAL